MMMQQQIMMQMMGMGAVPGQFIGGGDVPEEIQEICKPYNIDVLLQQRLAKACKSKEDQLKYICSSLSDTLKEARNPPGLLSVKCKELEQGTFAGLRLSGKSL